MADPGDQMNAGAAGRGRMRASHADREQVIAALKVAFVDGRLTRDEFDTRPGRRGRPGCRPLARAAAGSGGCLVLAFALVLFAANVLDPHGLGNPYHPWSGLCVVVALGLVFTALGIFAIGVAASVEQRRSRRQPLPLPSTPFSPASAPGSKRPSLEPHSL